MSLRNIALIGASGNVGTAVLPNLEAAGSFNITILTRTGSTSKFPPHITVKEFSYDDYSSLVSALKGQDAVIAAVGAGALSAQKSLIDAAIEAGVKRFIPSEFGSDTTHPNFPKLRILDDKVKAQEYLQEKAAAGQIEYTTYITGPFFEFGLKTNFIGFNLAEKKVKLYDDGNTKFVATNVETVGKVVALGLGPKAAETKNKVVHTKSYLTTQNEIRAEYEKLTGQKWEVEHVATGEALIKSGHDLISSGNHVGIYVVLLAAIFDKNDTYGAQFKNDDTKGWVEERTLADTVKRTLE